MKNQEMSSSDPAARLRARMVAQLRERGVLSDPRVAAALGQVPRHVFVPGVDLSAAYGDQVIITRHRDGMPTSSASQPAMVATMLEQLRPPPGGRILEIGAGTGYNAALLSHLVGPTGRVVTIDIDPEVAGEARDHLAQAGVTNAEVITGDGALGWASNAPYDGIIVTAGTSDLAPAWADQLAPQGRLVVPLSIRGVQQCVAFTQAGGHLRSDTVSGCSFMPLAGSMAHADQRYPVPGQPGVLLQAAPDTAVDISLVRDTLNRRGPTLHTGITTPAREIFAGLRPWLAFHEPASATLTYTGPPETADASVVPAVIEFTLHGIARRSSPCILGPAGLAVLDSAGPAAGSGPGRTVELAVRIYGQAEPEAARLCELIAAWDAASRPGTARLRIDAYPPGALLPSTGGITQHAPHATFMVSLPPAMIPAGRRHSAPLTDHDHQGGREHSHRPGPPATMTS